MKDSKQIEIITKVLIALTLFGICAWFFIQPAIESKAFNKFRDPNEPKATYFDAMFTQLRITSE